MDQDQLQGKADEAMGEAREKLGEMSGNPEMQAQGAMQKHEGKSQGLWGRIKGKFS